MIPRMIDFSSRIPNSLCVHPTSDERAQRAYIDELAHCFNADTFLI
jgi:hypothetical protein